MTPFRTSLSVLLCLCAATAQAQQVSLNGVMGSKALLLVEGGAPRMVAPGESHQGVRLVSAQGDEAVVELNGRRLTLRVGDAPASVGARAQPGAGTRIVLPMDSGGHFLAGGQINGREMRFLVDTGATQVALSVADAERIGLAYKQGQQTQVATANGASVAWRVKLGSIRIGDVEVFDVDATVIPTAMPFALLGNSFLNRFSMRRDSAQMVLERRY